MINNTETAHVGWYRKVTSPLADVTTSGAARKKACQYINQIMANKDRKKTSETEMVSAR
jgi:hypothetical protein